MVIYFEEKGPDAHVTILQLNASTFLAFIVNWFEGVSLYFDLLYFRECNIYLTRNYCLFLLKFITMHLELSCWRGSLPPLCQTISQV